MSTETGRARTRTIAIATAAAVAAVAATAVVGTAGGDSQSDDGEVASASQATATTKIVRQDLVERETVDGTLGYSDARSVINRLSGTVTWTPKLGAVVQTNRRLYEVDGEPVYLLDGAAAVFRALEPGIEGDDVLALERNLRALDLDPYTEMTVDGDWDSGTTAAVQRWQEAKGLDETGTIELGRIVFQPGDRRVAAVEVGVGESAGGTGAQASSGTGTEAAATSSQLMTTTSTKRIVAVDLEATKQSLARRGASVRVEFPDGDDVTGTIASVGKVAQKKVTASNDDPPATIKLIIKLGKQATPGLDQAPVDVKLTKERAESVLAIPVTALIVQQGGGFAVEVRDGNARKVVPVETGLSTDSFVEIKGSGLDEGMTITDARV